MKTTTTVALLSLGLLGCVTSREEMAADSNSAKTEELIPVTQTEESADKADNVITASGTEPGNASEFKKTNNGLKYKIIKPGTGKRPNANSTVVCHYRGWLDSGKEFDSSYSRNEPTEFPLNGVIAGWTEGLQLIKEGGKIELEVPSRLGYGAQGMPGAIPPNARLHFMIELLKVK